MIPSIPSSILKYKVTRFLGGTRNIAVGNHPEYNFQRTSPFTLAGWFKWTQTSIMSVVGKLANTTPGGLRGYDIFLQNGRAGFSLWNSFAPNVRATIETDQNTFADDRWHHIVATSSGSSTAAGMHVYVDAEDKAVHVDSDNLTLTIQNTVPFRIGIGQTNLNLPYTGLLHDIAVYNKELSAAEVATIHASHCPPDLTEVGPTANLVGYWLCGEHRGDPDLTAGITSFPSVPDMSPSNRDGTMTNMLATAIETRK